MNHLINERLDIQRESKMLDFNGDSLDEDLRETLLMFLTGVSVVQQRERLTFWAPEKA